MKEIIMCLLFSLCFKANSQISFIKQWSSPPIGNSFFVFVELPDSTFILGGVQSSGFGSSALIMRCDYNGDSLYAFIYDSGAIGAMALLNDSEIVVTGMVADQWKDNIVKINVFTGDTSYQKIYPFSLVTPYIYRCSDNGYICLSWNAGSYTFMKLDSNYNIQWHQPGWNMTYGANQIKPDPGGGYIAVGNGGYVSNPYIVQRFDSAGNTVWAYGYGNVPAINYDDSYDATDVVIADDSNYIVSCAYFNKTFMKIDRINGDTVWTKSGKSARLINNAGNDTYLTVTDSFGLINGNGDFIWQTQIVPQNFIINHGAKTLDGGYAFCGRVGLYTMVLVKLDSMGHTVNTAMFDIASGRQLRIYPNPVSDVLNFSAKQNAGDYTFCVYSFSGNKVIEVRNKSSVDVSGLPSGFYVAEVREGIKVVREKFVKE